MSKNRVGGYVIKVIRIDYSSKPNRTNIDTYKEYSTNQPVQTHCGVALASIIAF